VDRETAGNKTKYPGLRPLPPDFVKDYPPLALVVEEKCIACDRCPPLCFFDALVMEARPDHPFKRTAVVIPDNCTGCGLCFEACPVNAILWVPDTRGGKGTRQKNVQLHEDTDL
jgi:formate hydrogenlyase subunit 6/NADH:ubiquinone oxidoreductase subunit I